MGTYDGEGYYVKDVLIILDSARSAPVLKKLIALLNSKLMQFYYNTSFPTLHVQRNELASLPIKVAIRSGRCLQKAVTLVDRIMEAKRADPSADVSGALAATWGADCREVVASDRVDNARRRTRGGVFGNLLALRHSVVPDPYTSDLEAYALEVNNGDEPVKRVGKANTVGPPCCAHYPPILLSGVA